MAIYAIVKLNNKAAYYETLVIMIDEKINELKAGMWEKAQLVRTRIR